MKNSIVIGIVVAMAAGVVITGSTLPAVSAQGNMTYIVKHLREKISSIVIVFFHGKNNIAESKKDRV